MKLRPQSKSQRTNRRETSGLKDPIQLEPLISHHDQARTDQMVTFKAMMQAGCHYGNSSDVFIGDLVIIGHSGCWTAQIALHRGAEWSNMPQRGREGEREYEWCVLLCGSWCLESSTLPPIPPPPQTLKLTRKIRILKDRFYCFVLISDVFVPPYSSANSPSPPPFNRLLGLLNGEGRGY